MTNRILTENSITAGVAPKSYWDVGHSRQIEGFATDMSVNAGTRVDFKINVNDDAGSDYKVEIFRLGYYGGNGAREVAEWTNSNATVQPDALYDESRALVDAGNWSVTDSWNVPADAVSGVYLARLQRLDASGNPIAGEVNQIPFVVRNDGVQSDIMLQTSDTTWHAYNGWFGNNGQVGANFYGDASGTVNHPDIPGAGSFAQDRAYAVSYNRPFITRDGTSPASGGQDYLFGADYAAIYWLEQQGYDVSYISGVDTDRLGVENLLNSKAFISVGHDEYWSGGQFDNVEAARDAGVNLLFWSGNEVYWKTRWESAISADGTAYRTLVCYKETWAHANPNAGPEDYYNLDPTNIWTGTWRDTRFHGNPLSGGGNPADVDPISGLNPSCHCAENMLTGQLFGPDGTGEFGGALDVPAQFAALRVWRDTTVANGGKLDIAPGILGYEWNTSPEDDLRPDGLIKLSGTTIPWSGILVDDGNTVQPGTATHNLSLYRDDSGALVFGAGTVFWSWALSDIHDSSPYGAQIKNTDIQQFTINMFADMGIQPAVADAILISQGLKRASGSTDATAAVASINNLPDEAPALSPVTITGTATDNDGNPLTADGKVAVVEVSLDGGANWRVATTTDGWATWSYTWNPVQVGNYTIRARAIDDSLNVANAASDTEAITVTLPEAFSLFGGTTATGTVTNDGAAVELGMRFLVDRAGTVTQLKYWRASQDAGDTDVREGHLWRTDGTLLGTATFTSVAGASGWQTAVLSSPVALAAGTEYVVSYRTANNYFSSGGYFDPTREVSFDGVDNDAFSGPFGVVRAPQDGGGGNGLYRYGSGAAQMPNQSYQSENYWVDVTFVSGDTGSNGAPTITSPATLSTPENRLSAGSITATDPDGNVLSYSIVGGADAARFSINGATGALSFLTAPNFEVPVDANGDNAYAITVSVSDGIAAAVTQAVTVTVTDVNESGGPTNLFAAGEVPITIKTDDATDYELGTKIQATSAGWITDLRYFRGAADAGDTDVRTLNLWNSAGQRLAQVAVTSTPGTTGWQVGTLTAPVAIQAGITYVISYGTTQNYAYSQSYFTSAHTSTDGLLTALASGASGGNGVYAANTPGVFPTATFNASNYWVDATFRTTLGSAPVITSPAAFNVAENQTLAATIAASDADGDTLSYAIAGGADSARFAINAATGALAFLTAPDFEVPSDANGNNVYEVTVRVTDGLSAAVTQAVNVTVTNVDDAPPNQPPTITSPASFSVAENQTAVAAIAATDADSNTLTYAIAGGADGTRFAINATTGALSFLSAPDFEAPTDANGDNVYQVSVSVSDGVAVPVTQAVAVTVTDVVENRPPSITSPASFTAAENQTVAGTVTASDPDGNPLTYSISGGADAARFAINPTTGALAFVSAPNFEAPADANGDNIYQLTVRVSDGVAAVTQAVSVAVTDVVEVNSPPTIGPIVAPNTNEDAAPVQINLLAGANDPEGGSLTVFGPVTATSSNAARVVAITVAGSGVLTLNPAQFGDLLAGQSEVVTISYQISDGVNQVANTATFTVEGRDDTVPGQTITGTSAANTLIGGEGPDTIRGLGGNDTLRGNGGNDTLDGGSGVDSIDAGNGDDIILIRGSEGQTDPVVGGAGTDTLQLDGTATVSLSGTALLSGVEVLQAGGRTLSGNSDANTLNLSVFSSVTGLAALLGGSGNDTLIGSGVADTLDGGSGTDNVDGGAGDDVILVRTTEASGDTMAGGDGTDTLRAEGTSAWSLNGTNLITGIERLEGGGLVLQGTTGNNVIDLSAFAVTNVARINGLSGNDTLTGSALADALDGGSGTDNVDGGAGDDVIVVRTNEALGDTMAGDAGIDTLRVEGTSAWSLNGTNLITGVERLEGGGLALQGTSVANVIDLSAFTVSNVASINGLNGNDTLTGSSGADTLDGGANVDVVNGGGGDDTIVVRSADAQTDTMNGGEGFDRILVDASLGPAFTIAGTSRLSSIERIEGAGMQIRGTNSTETLDFSLMEVANVNAIQGLGGNDTITGSTGADTILGGTGADTFVFRFDRANGADTISDFDLSGNDVIRLAGFSPTSNLAAATSFDAAGALIDLDLLGGDGSIRLSGVTGLSFTNEDFVFA